MIYLLVLSYVEVSCFLLLVKARNSSLSFSKFLISVLRNVYQGSTRTKRNGKR